jgi:Ca2+-transporting ATPase
MSQQWWQLSAAEVANLLKTSANNGLTWEEAESRLEENGKNQLLEMKKISPLTLFLNQFKDFMVLVLLAATLISGLLGEYMDAITIIAIVVINAILGFIQEYRAEQSLHSLKKLSAPQASVIRSGQLDEIPAHDLVVGDVIVMESGDRVPADVRLIACQGFYVEESALTGESVPVQKTEDELTEADLPIGDQRNMAFMGTMVTRGSARGIVVETGMSTEMGKIADLIQQAEEMQTPLQYRLEQLGKVLIAAALALTALVVVIGIWHGHDTYAMFLAGVSLAVAAIPEGLPAIVTIALALGVQRMIRRNAIVRKLPSVETLGCASVICSDKTGTLTQNKMTVTRIWTNAQALNVTGSGYDPDGQFLTEKGHVFSVRRDETLKLLLEIGALCNNAELYEEEEKTGKRFQRETKHWVVYGDPTEGALLVAAAKGGISFVEITSAWQREKEFPFDSQRKMMSVAVRNRHGERRVLAKGAPDVLAAKCGWILLNGKEVPLSKGTQSMLEEINRSFAQSALRNLAFAYKRVTSVPEDESEAERDLVFVGLMGMIDPPREEVREAILTCHRAGIKTVMITGDHQVTAEAIARQLGMLRSNGMVIDGRELNQMDDLTLAEKVQHIDVYARVSPEHKLRIVKALQNAGHVVAMTGDGVNDAPAIKSADIGIAMGIAGTDVSKEASSLVLRDDNFSTIVAAVEEGRSIYENIRKFIRYLLASNVGEILTMFMAMLLGLPLPLVPIQILWVNLVTDGLPAMALGVDKAEEDIMNRPPRSSRENIFARSLGWKIVTRGFLIGLVTLAVFIWVLEMDDDDLTKAQTMAFATLVMAQLIHVFDCRSNKSVYARNPLENKPLILAVLSSVVLLAGVIYWPAMQPIFHTTEIELEDWFIVLLAASIPTFFAGLGGLFSKRRTVKRGIHSFGR